MLFGGTTTAAPATIAVKDLGGAVRFFVERLGTKLVALTDDAATIDLGDDFTITLTLGAAPASAVTVYARTDLPTVRAIFAHRGIALEEGPDGLAFETPFGARIGLAAHP